MRKNKKKETEQSSDYKDLYLRLLADFQNYKKRTELERVVWIKSAQRDVITPLISVLDDLDRACETFKDNKKVFSGLELTRKNTKKIFDGLGVSEIDCSGKFDPELHEAVAQVESDDHESDQIIDVMSKGYVLDSHVLRHAKVSVAK